MISTYLDRSGLVGTYETMSGALGIARYMIVVDRPEIPGYAAGESHREVVEAVFVSAIDATAARWALSGVDAGQSIADILMARAIEFRFAHHATAPDAPAIIGERPSHAVMSSSTIATVAA